jgi:hypothetical protein
MSQITKEEEEGMQCQEFDCKNIDDSEKYHFERIGTFLFAYIIVVESF